MSQERRLEYTIQRTHTHMLTLLQMCGITPALSVFMWPLAGVLRDVALTNLQTVIGPLRLSALVLIPVFWVQAGNGCLDRRGVYSRQ